jgi:hypothetical protein
VAAASLGAGAGGVAAGGAVRDPDARENPSPRLTARRRSGGISRQRRTAASMKAGPTDLSFLQG